MTQHLIHRPATIKPKAGSAVSSQAVRQVSDVEPPAIAHLAGDAKRGRRLHRRDAAAYLGVSLSWLDKSRMTGTGPPYISIGGRVVYDQADLDAFLARNKRMSVSG